MTLDSMLKVIAGYLLWAVAVVVPAYLIWMLWHLNGVGAVVFAVIVLVAYMGTAFWILLITGAALISWG